MRTDQILNLDYREEENKEIIQKVLRKIKPLSRYSLDEDVPIEVLEKLVKVMVHKYEITPQWINITYDEPVLAIYSVGVKETVNHEWLGNVYGMCIYELFAKLSIKMYAEIKKGKIPKRQPTEVERQRTKRLERKLSNDS